MRRFVVVVAAALIAVAVAVGTVAGAGSLWKAPPFQSIGISQVGLGDDQFVNPALIQTFIPTGSASGNCLLTLNEASMGPWPTTLICSARQQMVAGRLEFGLMINISLPEPPVEPGYGIVVSLYQEGAKYYGAPVPCEVGSRG